VRILQYYIVRSNVTKIDGVFVDLLRRAGGGGFESSTTFNVKAGELMDPPISSIGGGDHSISRADSGV
jgi:hypothetical protein